MERPRPCIIIPADESLPVRVVREQSTELAALQALVGGNIQWCHLTALPRKQLEIEHDVKLGPKAAMYCDESGRINGKPQNPRATALYGDWIYGVCGDVFVMDVP